MTATDARRLATMRRRGVDAVVWGMPAVNYALMYRAAVKQLNCRPNEIVYWSRLLDWHNQTLTPNPDAIYFMPFFDLSQGPVVLDVPAANDEAAIIGSLMDGWQVPLEDVGKAGVDQGAGGRYLLLPPEYQDEVPDGFIPLRSSVFVGYGLLRSSIASGADADVAAAVDYGKQLAMYPLSAAEDPPATTFLDAADVDFDATLTTTRASSTCSATSSTPNPGSSGTRS